MARVDTLRARLARATELGVPSREFLRHELEEGRALQSHLNSRLAQAGQEAEDAVHELEDELANPQLSFMRMSARLADDDDDDV